MAVSSSLYNRKKEMIRSGNVGEDTKFDEDWFVIAFDDVPVLKVKNRSELENYKEEILSSIRMEKVEEWDIKIKAMKSVRSLALYAPYQNDKLMEEVLMSLIKGVWIKFMPMIRDPRSQLVLEVCVTIAFLVKTFQKKLDVHLVSILISGILNRAIAGRKGVVVATVTTLKFIFVYLHDGRLLNELAKEGRDTKSKDVRNEVIGLLPVILEHWSLQELRQQQTLIEDMLCFSLEKCDVSGKVIARKAYWIYNRDFPGRAEELLKLLDRQTQKMLLKAKYDVPDRQEFSCLIERHDKSKLEQAEPTKTLKKKAVLKSSLRKEIMLGTAPTRTRKQSQSPPRAEGHEMKAEIRQEPQSKPGSGKLPKVQVTKQKPSSPRAEGHEMKAETRQEPQSKPGFGKLPKVQVTKQKPSSPRAARETIKAVIHQEPQPSTSFAATPQVQVVQSCFRSKPKMPTKPLEDMEEIELGESESFQTAEPPCEMPASRIATYASPYKKRESLPKHVFFEDPKEQGPSDLTRKKSTSKMSSFFKNKPSDTKRKPSALQLVAKHSRTAISGLSKLLHPAETLSQQHQTIVAKIEKRRVELQTIINDISKTKFELDFCEEEILKKDQKIKQLKDIIAGATPIGKSTSDAEFQYDPRFHN